jgi:DNA primase
LSDFFFERLSSQLDIDSIDGRARLVNLANPLLAKLPDSMFRQLMVERLAELAGTGSSSLAGRLDKPPATQPPPRPVISHARGQAGTKSPVRQAIELLLYQPALAEQLGLPPLLEHSELPGVSLLFEIINLLQRQPGLNTGAILEHWRNREEGRYLHKLASWNPALDNLELAADLQGYMNEIQRQHIENRIDFLNSEQSHRVLNAAETREYGELLVQSHAVRQNQSG